MDLYNSSEITVHQLNELKQDDKKIQIIDVREDTINEYYENRNYNTKCINC